MKPWARAAISLGIIASTLIVTLAVFRLPIFESLKLLFDGGIGTRYGVARTLIKSTPLMLTGLGAIVAWRAGMYNIGGEGQYLIGALFGAAIAKFVVGTLPPSLALVGILVGCAIGGAVWAWVAGWLFVRRGVEVVISTILLNFIAAQALDWAVSAPLKERKGQLPQTDMLPESVMLPKLDRQLDLHVGVMLAVIVTIAVWWWIRSTKAGFRLRLVGASATAARANRIDAHKVQITSMMLSGALCGLAGGIEYVGLTGQVGQGFGQQWGFLGIPIALLANLNPIAVIPSALFGGALFAGSENLARFTPAGATLVYVVQAMVVLGLVAVNRWVRKPVAAEGA